MPARPVTKNVQKDAAGLWIQGKPMLLEKSMNGQATLTKTEMAWQVYSSYEKPALPSNKLTFGQSENNLLFVDSLKTVCWMQMKPYYNIQ